MKPQQLELFMLQRSFVLRVEVNGQMLSLHSFGKPEFRLPGTDLFLSEHVEYSYIVRASGLHTYDYALPQAWFDEYLKKHGKTPRGVWCYDSKSLFGEFVSVEDMLKLIAKNLIARGINTLYGMA